MAERDSRKVNRREFLTEGVRNAAALVLGGTLGALATRAAHGNMVWQIDPNKCIQCERCETECVLEISAVKCIHSFAMCGYCELCTGFFEAEPNDLNTAAENQQCPTNAITRTFIEDPYYEYTIDEELCIGCAKCVKGCESYGNGSLFLQVRHDRCLNCNQCTIAAVCPSQAFTRVPASQPYLLKNREEKS